MISFYIIFFLFVVGGFIYFSFCLNSLFPKGEISIIKTNQKIVVLTFDDGPNPPYSIQIGDFLAGHKVQATFFQVGKNIEKYPEVTLKLHRQGHIIGNHLYSHSFSTYLKKSSFEKELQRTQEVIAGLIKKKPKFFRPPWLSAPPFIFEIAKKNNLLIIGGQLSSFFETYQPPPRVMAKEVFLKVKPGSIIIFHDGFSGKKGATRQNTFKTVEIVLSELIKRGYKIVSLAEALNINPYQ